MISPASESDALHLILRVRLNPSTDFGLISVRRPQPPGNLVITVCVADCICRVCRILSRFTHPANRWVGVTVPNTATVYHVSDWGLRRGAVQVAAQVTVTMASYKYIPNQSQSGCLSHVPKSLNSQRFKGCSNCLL